MTWPILAGLGSRVGACQTSGLLDPRGSYDLVAQTITTELMECADGHPIGYVDATAVAVFVYQQPDGAFVIDICSRGNAALSQLSLLLDGEPLPITHARLSQ